MRTFFILSDAIAIMLISPFPISSAFVSMSKARTFGVKFFSGAFSIDFTFSVKSTSSFSVMPAKSSPMITSPEILCHVKGKSFFSKMYLVM